MQDAWLTDPLVVVRFVHFTACVMAAGTAAFAVLAAKRGLSTEARGRKSFYYAAGLMEGTETVVFFVLFCLFPDWFAVLAWVFGGLCWLTTAARIVAAVGTFRGTSGAPMTPK